MLLSYNTFPNNRYLDIIIKFNHFIYGKYMYHNGTIFTLMSIECVSCICQNIIYKYTHITVSLFYSCIFCTENTLCTVYVTSLGRMLFTIALILVMCVNLFYFRNDVMLRPRSIKQFPRCVARRVCSTIHREIY